MVNGSATRQIAVQGTDATLPAIPLRPAGLTIVQAFVDSDGDGEQDEGEAGVGGVSVTLSGPTAVQPQDITLAAGKGVGAALAVIAPGQVRGTVWLDGNGDGLRQPWESPLAGVPVSLSGQTTLTDGQGRYAFSGIAPGTYTLAADLPVGLSAVVGPVMMQEGRGAVVGIAAIEQHSFQSYLPLVLMRR